LDPSIDRPWLVRSSGIILGPFSLEEMISGLRERRIGIIDEVRSPDHRWSFIREHRQFTEIVQFLRDQQSLQKDDTGVTFVGTKSITKSTDDLTPTPAAYSPKDERKEEADVREVDSSSSEIVDSVGSELSEKNSRYPEKNYVFDRDPKVRGTVDVQNRTWMLKVWSALALVLALGGVLVFLLRTEPPKSLRYEDYIRLARTNRGFGNYEKALDFYRKAGAIKPLDATQELQMLGLALSIENQSAQMRVRLEFLKKNFVQDQRSQAEIDNLVALSFLREGRLEEARKQYEEILAKNKTNETERVNSKDIEAIKVNLAQISILEGDFERARRDVNRLSQEGIQEPLLLLFRALISYRTQTGDKLASTVDDLKRFMTKTQDYQSEVLLLIAASQKKMGKTSEMQETLNSLLSADPDLTEAHRHYYLLHQEVLAWGYLGNVCQQLLENMPESAPQMGLKTSCFYQQADMSSAIQEIEKARSQYVGEPILYGIHAYLLYRSGRFSEANAMGELPQADKSQLLTLVQARICEAQKDWSCARDNWEKLDETSSHRVEVIAGMARAAFEMGQREEASDLVTQGLLLSGEYRPLIEMKDQLNDH